MITNATMSAVLPADNLERARRFYEGTLGFKPVDAGVEAGGILYGAKDSVFLVYETKARRGEATQASLRVDDLEAEMADLRSRGITFEEYDLPGLKTVNGIVEMGGTRGAWFKDSEGNILALVQMK
jgi:catechol 2,3-dioxygenase-like lactoylglutathione lyase family enzyme